MLREETDSETVDYRVAKADGRALNNHHKVLNYLHLDRKRSDHDDRVYKRKQLFNETTEDEDRSEEEERAEVQKADANRDKEEDGNEQENANIGECAVCHITINKTNLGGSIVDSENTRFDSYLLCQHCIQKISIQSDAKDLRSRKSQANFSQSKDNGRVRRSSKTHDSPTTTYPRSPSRCALEPRRDLRTCSFNGTTTVNMNNDAIDCESIDVVSYAVDRDRCDPRLEVRTEDRVSKQQIYRDPTMTRNNAAERCASEIQMKASSQVSSADCSRRPIRCPRLDCSVNVAFSALTHHFLFDHPEVPILSVEPGTKSTLVVGYGGLPCNSTRCLALLLVSGKLSDSAARLFGGNQINHKYRNRLPLPVLAARLQSNRNYACCEEMHGGGEGQCEKDTIIAWVAGLDVGDTADRLRCSIQAVDSIENGGFRSLTYTGPVMSLRTAQSPRDVLSAGDCIVLHEGLIGHITSGCTNLNVNVIVH